MVSASHSQGVFWASHTFASSSGTAQTYKTASRMSSKRYRARFLLPRSEIGELTVGGVELAVASNGDRYLAEEIVELKFDLRP
jgi:hypothetical protein